MPKNYRRKENRSVLQSEEPFPGFLLKTNFSSFDFMSINFTPFRREGGAAINTLA